MASPRRRRTSSPLQGPPGTRPVRGLRTLRSAKCRARSPSSRCESPVLAFSVRAVRVVLRLTQLHCWVAPSPEVSSPASGPAHFLRSRSSVRLRRGQTWLLFLQALRHFCSAGGPRVRSASLRSVLGKNAAKPSGQPGHSAPALLAQTKSG